VKPAPPLRPPARGLRIAVLRARWNAAVTGGLLEGALSALQEMGARAKDVTVHEVPGAFELPVVAAAAARSGRYDAVVALGAVIKGQTDHYEHVAREAASGLAAVALETGVPVSFGVLTVQRARQAARRAAPGRDNKGAEAARAAVATARVVSALSGRGRRASRRGHR
jgi:6,7-dimethyl-8-ribityllumazine synthase